MDLTTSICHVDAQCSHAFSAINRWGPEELRSTTILGFSGPFREVAVVR